MFEMINVDIMFIEKKKKKQVTELLLFHNYPQFTRTFTVNLKNKTLPKRY